MCIQAYTLTGEQANFFPKHSRVISIILFYILCFANNSKVWIATPYMKVFVKYKDTVIHDLLITALFTHQIHVATHGTKQPVMY